MFIRGITLPLAALFAAGLMVEAADADQHKKPRRIATEEGRYPGPPLIRAIPGLRIFFGDYALSDEEFDELYVTPRRANRDNEATEREQPKQKKSKAAAKPVEQKKAPVKTAATGLSCDKAASVVSGFGFSGVTPSSCSGKVYAFNATRDGKSFAIKLDPKSGELTEVKKLP